MIGYKIVGNLPYFSYLSLIYYSVISIVLFDYFNWKMAS